MKTALQIPKNGDPEDMKVKEQAQTEKANNCSEDNPSWKEPGGRWLW